MSETLNQNSENVGNNNNDFASSMESAPKFDPEAAKAKIAEYKANHPDAVEDVDKAYTMAKRSDRAETNRAHALQQAEAVMNRQPRKLDDDTADLVNKQSPEAAFNAQLQDAEQFGYVADEEAEKAAAEYDRLKAAKQR